MPAFTCLDARPELRGAGPSILLSLRIKVEPGQRVHSLALRTQIRIEPRRRRRYNKAEVDKLVDLFGDPSRWGQTLHPLQLCTVSTMVQGFVGQTTTELSVPLSYDIDVAASRYLHGLEEGEVPLLLLFSGTVFTEGPDGVQVGLVPWSEEASYRLPVSVWRAAMDEHFPGSAWLRMRRETLDALLAYRSQHALASWDDTLLLLLKEAGS
jgi:hypothetical protein